MLQVGDRVQVLKDEGYDLPNDVQGKPAVITAAVRINPNTGRSTTAIVQISFFSLEAELWKMLIIAQISPASISTPHRLLYPKFIISYSLRVMPSASIAFVAAWCTVGFGTHVQKENRRALASGRAIHMTALDHHLPCSPLAGAGQDMPVQWPVSSLDSPASPSDPGITRR